MTDRVPPLKQESAEGDLFPTEFDPLEDGIDVRAVYLQNDSSDDGTVEVSRDVSDNMTFKDGVVGGTKTLTELLASGGLTETTHKTLRQLIHLAESGGPWDGFATAPYREPKSGSGPWDHGYMWWKSSGKTNAERVIEKTISRNANKTPSTIVWVVYDSGGSALVTATDTYAYTGGSVVYDSITRTFS